MSPRALIPASLLAGACLAGSGLSQDAADRPLRVLIDRNLDRQLIELVSIDDGRINYIDAAGKPVSAPTDDFVALAPIDAWQGSIESTTLFARGGIVSRPGVLELTDGQRLVGTASVADAGEESLAWNHARLGLVGVPLENVRRVVLPRIMTTNQSRPPLAVESEDVLRLANGDTLRGFIASFGSSTVIELGDGSVLDMPMNVLDEMTLANPAEPATGICVWLTGGNVLEAQQISTPTSTDEPDRLIITLADGPITRLGAASVPSEADELPSGLRLEIDRAYIEGVNFDAAALVPLASLDASLSGRSLEIDSDKVAALGAQSIRMPGPMSATWAVPRGTTRMSLKAELPIDARTWGNLELVFLVDGVERERHTLSAESPQAHVRIDLINAKSLTITLDEGKFGPVQDRAVLREAILLIGR